MAMLIRDTYQLPTLRISLRPSRSGNQVRFQCYQGESDLGAVEVAATDLGILEDLEIGAYRFAEFRIPSSSLDFIRQALHPLENGEPLWMIVDSSGYLAVVPWEQLLQPALGVPLLRIPNFLADPLMLSGPLRLALCLSSPMSKTPFDIPAYARAMVQAIRRGVPQGTRLHVFADAQVYHQLLHTLPADNDRHQIEIHDPKNAEPFGIGDVDRSLSDAADHLKSPWLLWMHHELTSGIDAAHFVCAGYFRRDRAALALARSPLLNVDRDWAHFVGAQELKAFLQLLGGWSVMFSPPYENVWSIGPRVVAGSLAWQRPGSVLVHDIHHPGDLGEKELEAAYRFLFAGEDAPPPASPGIMLYVHPKLVAQYRGWDEIESAPNSGVPREISKEVLPALRSRRPSSAGETEPAWRQVARVQMDQQMMRLKTSDSATTKGIARGIQELSSILDDGGDS